ncbi:hypothetical protein [Phaeacidiphilus oryzae]|uniref:hypothetical protein n=1 Tax=Phaeacidiphilus oryzae TaxID=348818 RepID=UPI0005674F56|nr:hypothetical protein [Phaeacidiphilus oryzae]
MCGTPDLTVLQARVRAAWSEVAEARDACRALPPDAGAEARLRAQRRLAVCEVHHAVAQELLRLGEQREKEEDGGRR